MIVKKCKHCGLEIAKDKSMYSLWFHTHSNHIECSVTYAEPKDA